MYQYVYQHTAQETLVKKSHQF